MSKKTEKTNTFEELKLIVVPLLKPYAKRISVFGSVARGDNEEESDIDLLVDLKPPDRRPVLGFKWFRLEKELKELLGKKVDLISEKEISPHLKPIIEQEKILLYEENEQ